MRFKKSDRHPGPLHSFPKDKSKEAAFCSQVETWEQTSLPLWLHSS